MLAWARDGQNMRTTGAGRGEQCRSSLLPNISQASMTPGEALGRRKAQKTALNRGGTPPLNRFSSPKPCGPTWALGGGDTAGPLHPGCATRCSDGRTVGLKRPNRSQTLTESHPLSISQYYTKLKIAQDVRLKNAPCCRESPPPHPCLLAPRPRVRRRSEPECWAGSESWLRCRVRCAG